MVLFTYGSLMMLRTFLGGEFQQCFLHISHAEPLLNMSEVWGMFMCPTCAVYLKIQGFSFQSSQSGTFHLHKIRFYNTKEKEYKTCDKKEQGLEISQGFQAPFIVRFIGMFLLKLKLMKTREKQKERSFCPCTQHMRYQLVKCLPCLQSFQSTGNAQRTLLKCGMQRGVQQMCSFSQSLVFNLL